MTFCPSCGAEKKEGSKFCHNCGYAFPDTGLGGENLGAGSVVQESQPFDSNFNVNQNPNQGMPTSENPHNIPKILGYICAILIPLFGLIFGIYMYTRPEENAKKHGKIIIGISVVIWALSIIALGGY